MTITEIYWSTHFDYPILACLQLFPLLIAAIIFANGENKKLPAISIGAALVELFLSISLYINYDAHNSAMQFAEQITLYAPFQYHAAVDGVSVLFILLTAILSTLLILYSYVIPMNNRRSFLALTFIIISSLMGQFTTLDMMWFVLTSIIYLLIVGYILWNWATSPDRDIALSRYLQFMITGFVLLIIGVVMLGWNHSDVTGRWSFDLIELLETPVNHSYQSIIFFLLFYGLAIRIPLFPLHGWLPLAAEHGTVVIAPVFLLGLKTGIYALIRFVFPLLPDAIIQWHEYVVAFAVTGVFYAALLALMQVNLRRLLAFAVVSHTSILIIGLFSLNHQAFQGGLLLSVNFGLATTGLLITTGFIFWRTKTMLLAKLGGLFETLPLFGITFFISGLSIIGMPGTPGFDSFHLILEASIHRFGALITVAAAIGNVIAAGFLLWAFQRAFLAPNTSPSITNVIIKPASVQEKFIALMIMAILLSTGFYSEPWFDLIENSLASLSYLYEHKN